jgi:FlaA1/EpsC-like NDP-sugar epimerase
VQEDPAEKAILGETILRTGAGGFIGSALAEAIRGRKPGHLMVLDHSERSLNEIDARLAANTPRDLYTSVLGDTCEAKLLSEVFQSYGRTLRIRRADAADQRSETLPSDQQRSIAWWVSA